MQQDRIYHCPPNPTADGITVLPVVRTHGIFRYLWPFQSARQRRLFVVLVCVPLALAAALLWWLDPKAIPAVLPGCFIGGMAVFYMVLPARLRLTTQSEARHFIGDMDQVLVTLGYARQIDPADPARHHYRVQLWAWVEWTNWAEADIVFRVGAHEIIIDGPVGIFGFMGRRILRRHGA